MILFIGGGVLALFSFVAGIFLACSKRENKWIEAFLVGVGLPIVFGFVAFAGCGMAIGNLKY